MSLFARTNARLLRSSPNYIEITLLIAVMTAGRLFMRPIFWQFRTRVCVIAATLTVFASYIALGNGKILEYLGWIKPRRPIYWLYGALVGFLSAGLALMVLRLTHTSLGQSSGHKMFYGFTVGPILEEIIYRGAGFSLIYVLACSLRFAMHWRIALTIIVTSLLFVISHTGVSGISWLIILTMGLSYGLMRWRSNSTAVTAVMHASYNLLIAAAMIFH
jgi:membrane protease YdiL (CAAX protease family)